MEMFVNNPVAADDPRLTAVYDNYRRNLVDICGIARRAGAAVVALDRGREPQRLSAVCLAASPRPVRRGPGEMGVLVQGGLDFEGRGDGRRPSSTRRRRRSTTASRSSSFASPAAWSKLGRFAEAKERFELARDLDVLRFRADSRINAVIRQVAGAEEAAGVRFADAAAALAESDPDGHGILGGRPFTSTST